MTGVNGFKKDLTGAPLLGLANLNIKENFTCPYHLRWIYLPLSPTPLFMTNFAASFWPGYQALKVQKAGVERKIFKKKVVQGKRQVSRKFKSTWKD